MVRLVGSTGSFVRLVKDADKKPTRSVVQSDKYDYKHNNWEGMDRRTLISVLEAHNCTPETIVTVLATFHLL